MPHLKLVATVTYEIFANFFSQVYQCLIFLSHCASCILLWLLYRYQFCLQVQKDIHTGRLANTIAMKYLLHSLLE